MHTRIFAVAAAALSFVACGPSFEGSFAGTLSMLTSCTDGTSATATMPASWSVSDMGDEIEVTPLGGSCGTFSGKVDGDKATLNPKSCPTTTTNGIQTTTSLQGGAVALYGSDAISATLNLAVSTPRGNCTALQSGTLNRAK
jgi:hypothetical protein